MKLLALETGADPATIAVSLPTGVTQRSLTEPRRHNEHILPTIDALLAEAGLRAVDLDGVVFGRGPGGFTGVRLATTIALAMHTALDVPLLGIDSLMLQAEAARRLTGADRIAVARDARMGEAYFGQYRWRDSEQHWQTVTPPRLVRPSEDLPVVADSAAVGDGWRLPWLTALADRQPHRFPDVLAEAQDACALAPVLVVEQGWTDPDHAAPDYLRSAAAWR